MVAGDFKIVLYQLSPHRDELKERKKKPSGSFSSWGDKHGLKRATYLIGWS